MDYEILLKIEMMLEAHFQSKGFEVNSVHASQIYKSSVDYISIDDGAAFRKLEYTDVGLIATDKYWVKVYFQTDHFAESFPFEKDCDMDKIRWCIKEFEAVDTDKLTTYLFKRNATD